MYSRLGQEFIGLRKFINNKEQYHTSLPIERCNIFDQLYEPILLLLEVELSNRLEQIKKQCSFKINDSSIIKDAKFAFRSELIELLSKKMIGDLYEYINQHGQESEDSTENYQLYCNKNLNLEQLLNEFPTIESLIDKKLKNKVNLICDCLEKLLKDRNQIEEFIEEPIQVLSKMIFNSGDTHNSGKSVVILILNKDKKLVYKPHFMDGDRGFEKIVNWVNSKEETDCAMKTAKIIDCQEYGWQEYIEFRACNDVNQVKRYYYRIGMIIALLKLLNTRDIHYENIIAESEYPIIVDLEILISGKFTYDEESIVLDIKEIIDDSIFSSLIIPQNIEMMDKKYDMCGLSGGNGRDEVLVSKIINIGTDQIRYGNEKISIKEGYNKVKLNDENVDYFEYLEEIKKGFTDMYWLICNHKDEIRKLILGDHYFSGRYRQVVRPTAKYAKLLSVAYHPYYLCDSDKMYQVFNTLRGKAQTDARISALTDLEIEQMLSQGDIPYFYTTYDSLDLYTTNGKCVKGFYKITLRNLILSCLDSFHEKDYELQCKFLYGAFAGQIHFRDMHEYYYKPIQIQVPANQLVGTNQDYLLISKSIADYIIQEIQIKNENEWGGVALNTSSEGNVRFGNINYSLYEGGGIVVFFLRMYQITEETKYREACIKLLNGLEAIYKDKVDYFESSVFEGIGSRIYINYAVYKATGDEQCFERFERYIKILSEREADKEEIIDVIGGAAGIVILLSNIYKETPTDDIYCVIKKYGEHLYQRIKSGDRSYLTGFSHGYSGFMVAMVQLYKITKQEKYYEMFQHVLELENQNKTEDQCNWKDLRPEYGTEVSYWCHGAGGITLARSLIKDYVREDEKQIIEKDILTGIDTTLKIGSAITDCICHGRLGNLDLLLVVAKNSKDQKLFDKIEQIASVVTKQICKEGCKCATPLGAETTNFMIGLSGIGYGFLRLYRHEVPSVLALEV